ncbi:CC_3452 family protein [Sphingomonas sp. LT1P40]|uniref:CC_3452 family protein n=1 Tax=Alteristakelama amylovorans TaxID=3096166 RepID=UPI002FC9D693
MTRLASLAAAALTAAAFMPIAAFAQSGGYYSATAVEAPKKASFITQNTVWKCKDGTCTAPKTPMQDKVLCERVVQRVGALSAFTVGGTPFDAAALTACNARAN